MTTLQSLHSILVATDMTGNSDASIRAAADLAAVTGATLHVIHAHEEPSVIGDRDVLAVQRIVHDKRAALLSMVLEIAGRRVDAHTRVKVGSAAEIILEEAKLANADLIVVGAHRKKAIADRLQGATVEHVLRRATVPCLVVNEPLTLPIERILVPTDLSRHKDQVATVALGWADLLCRNGAAQVVLAHVTDTDAEADELRGLRPDLVQELRTAASDARRNAGLDLPVETKLLRGDPPSSTILGYADEIGAEMIVLGTHGDAVLVRALLGSVSSSIVRSASVPVLLVPRAYKAVTVESDRMAPEIQAASLAG